MDSQPHESNARFRGMFFAEFGKRVFMSIGRIEYKRLQGESSELPWGAEITCHCGRGTFLQRLKSDTTHMIEHRYSDPVDIRVFRAVAAAAAPPCDHWTLISNAELVIRRER